MNGITLFKNRQQAGKKLAEKLEKYRGQDAVVYALPRGGVVVGAEVAKYFNFHLDLILVRKIGHPQNPEFALGAISESGEVIGDLSRYGNFDKDWLISEVDKQRKEIKRRRELYLKGRQPINALGRIAIIVDDGIATGSTMIAAIEEIKSQNPKKIVVAVPVAPPDVAKTIINIVDEFVAVLLPDPFLGAIGAYYDEFNQVSDEEVIGILKQS